MPTGAEIMDRLNVWAAALVEAGHPDGGDALQLVRAGVDDLPACMGAPWNWRAAARLKARDDAILRLRAQFFPELEGRAAARVIANVLHRYETAGWLRDRCNHYRPDGASGACYDVLAAEAHVPGEARIRQILDADRERLAG